MAISSGRLRRSRAGLLCAAFTLLLAGASGSACSEQGSARSPDDSPLFVETAPTSLIVENRAGLPLTDITIVVLPYGPLQFSTVIGRLENTERRTIPFNVFRSRDGATFNARFHKPKAVRVTGRDTVGKTYEIEIPWS